MDWASLRDTWPHSDRSQFLPAGGVHWHLQQAGAQGPRVLLLHGTGASAHTWRDSLLPLADFAQVMAIDLPGHGFSGLAPGDGMSLPGMARGIGELLTALSWQVDVFVGHSAGAAIAMQMVLDQGLQPKALIGINPAWLPLPGLAGLLFPSAAKLLALTPLVPRWFAKQASSPGMLDKLLESTGSRLDARGQALYASLVASPSHAQGALNMMAAWDLSSGAAKLRRLQCPVHVMVGENDRTVPPAQAQEAKGLLRNATVSAWSGVGHLLHEEQPARFVADLQARLAAIKPAQA